MSAEKAQKITPSANRRPQSVLSLLYGGEAHANWSYANKRLTRFFVVNLKVIVGQLGLQVTKTEAYFRQAEKAIAEETTWSVEQPFEYTCSHTNIYDRDIEQPKRFGQAATIIVAMEFAAQDKNSTLNIYDYLRILPAQYFVDLLDRRRLTELEAFHNQMSEEDRQAKFGPLAQRSFEGVCLFNIEQSRVGLLNDLVEGYCVTKYTAEKLMTFINAHYPAHLRVGPVRSAGQHSISSGLGEQPAVKDLRVPKTIEPSLLLPCS